MGNIKLDIEGFQVPLRTKADLLNVIDDMLLTGAEQMKAGKTKTNYMKKAETATLGFFGSIKHYLEGGQEA